MLLYDDTLSLYGDTLSLCDDTLSLYGDTSFKHVFRKNKMTDIRMYDVLHRYGFSNLADNLERDKITPGILCLLSTQDMKKLEITNTVDMMKLRIVSFKYGSNNPKKDYSYGPLKFDIPEVTLQNLLEQGFMISEIAKMLVVSECNVYRRMAQFSLSKYNFSSICDEDLAPSM